MGKEILEYLDFSSKAMGEESPSLGILNLIQTLMPHGFWALVGRVAAAYTANLASFLVSPRVTVHKYNTIDKVIANNARVCVQNNAIIQEILQDEYSDLQLVPQEMEQGRIEELRQGFSNGGM